MLKTYRLVGHVAVPCGSVEGYLERISCIKAGKEDPWRVANTDLGKDRSVSTVFLGMDHNFFGGEPLLFETMIFTRDDSMDYMERCTTWEQAEAMHERAVQFAKTAHLRVIK